MFALYKIKKILNDPGMLDPNRDWMYLDEQNKSSVLIYELELGKKILAINSSSPFNTTEYFKAISNMELPSFDTYGKKLPMFLHGQPHFDARKQLNIFYKNIELSLLGFIDEKTVEYFQGSNNEKYIEPIKFTSIYLKKIFTTIIAQDLQCHEDEVPELPGEIFYMIPGKNKLQEYEVKIHKLNRFIEDRLSSLGRDSGDAWMFLSITIMGTDTLLSSLLYGMVYADQFNHDYSRASYAANPVTVIGRIINEALSFDDLDLTIGQQVYVAPGIAYAHQTVSPEKESLDSMAFGHGAHLCPGRKIAQIIIENYLKVWFNLADKDNCKDIAFKKDFINRPYIV